MENEKGSSVVDRLPERIELWRIMEHLLGRALLIVAVPFVLTTLYFGLRKGGYYDSKDYKGNGTAH
jgi:hypothetical protein